MRYIVYIVSVFIFMFFFAGCSDRVSCGNENMLKKIEKNLIDSLKQKMGLASIFFDESMCHKKSFSKNDICKFLTHYKNLKIDRSTITTVKKEDNAVICQAKYVIGVPEFDKLNNSIKYKLWRTDSGSMMYEIIDVK